MPICISCQGEILPEHVVTVAGCEEMCYPCYKQRRPTICVDFDGVLAEYNGWLGPETLGDPIPGALNFVIELQKMYAVVIHTTRDDRRVEEWCDKHGFIPYITLITSQKVPAVCYVDDRAVPFDGNFHRTLLDIKFFKPHWTKF